MILKKRLPTIVAVLVVLAVVVTMASLRVNSPMATKPLIVSGVSQWGALARQSVGHDATVVSLLSDPSADPHSHEATTSDAAYVSQALVVVENGAGYDSWLTKLVQARSSAPTTINVAGLMHVTTGQNPHIFYNLYAAETFVRALRSAMRGHGSYPDLERRSAQLLGQLSASAAQVRSIRQSCAGVRVAATEDVTGYLLAEMGLHVVTPEALRLAIGNSIDPSVGDLALAMQQLTRHPAFLVDNVQTATPLTNQMVAQARRYHVPVIEVTETMVGTNYVTWIDGVIAKMRAALQREGCVQ
ncbi:MAG TPA: zinc ABC transporter substrate-binding protein [Acidimicrobiales bacterium]|nr:zinc ABC transporter substrate-binding protein [Acidimicrobiales bacterium]